MANLEIRPLITTDKDDWARLWTGYLAFYEATRPQEIYDLYFDRLLGDDPQDYHGLIALSDGKAVGLAHYLSIGTAGRLKTSATFRTFMSIQRRAARGPGAP